MNKHHMDTVSYCRTEMQKELILEKIREKGFRLTKQRSILIDIILENECSSCKDIFYQAVKINAHIGIATAYRVINLLEEIGAISRKNMYKMMDLNNQTVKEACTIVLEDNTVYHLSPQKWVEVVKAGLNTYGYVFDKEIKSIIANDYESQKDKES